MTLISIICFSIIYSNDYIWPNDYEGQITTTFCEPRFRRFHAGIDIRTEGKIGSNIYAIDSGYINRIKIEPDNYGKAIYLKLNDGNIVLYSHLIRFNDKIEKFIKDLYYKYDSSFFDHTLNENEIILLNRGDIIGYAGDTGSVGGPHIHFEIRTENNEPINPLINHYNIHDTIPPIAKTISFIPINNKSWINDIQDYQTFDLFKKTETQYELKDTIKVQGNLGIAIETYDKINNLPIFKFGVYSIDLFINQEPIYSIKFDKYKFIENPLIYTEIDYQLLQEGVIAHRLFNQNSTLSFIKSNKLNELEFNNGYYNFLINISDVENNITQVRGVITDEISKNKPWGLSQINVEDITGNIKMKYLDSGLIIEFFEDIYSGLTPELELSSQSNNQSYRLYRKNKNLISSELININNLDKISIIYNTTPKITFEKKVITINPKIDNYFILDNGIEVSNMNEKAFYNDIIMWIENSLNLPISEKFDIIAEPITINPTNIPFKKKIKLEYEIDNNNYAFYKYNKKNESWSYNQTINEDNKITANISSGGTFSILSEKEKPVIYDIFPQLDRTYKKNDAKNISFHADDKLSGINPYKIKIEINGEKLFYDYIKYRNLVTAALEEYLILGENKIAIYIYDNLDNVQNIKGSFFIIE